MSFLHAQMLLKLALLIFTCLLQKHLQYNFLTNSEVALSAIKFTPLPLVMLFESCIPKVFRSMFS